MENCNLEAVFQVATNYGQIYIEKELKELTYARWHDFLPKLLLKNKGAALVMSEHFYPL